MTASELLDEMESIVSSINDVQADLKDFVGYGECVDEAMCYLESARQELKLLMEYYAPEAEEEERREREWMDSQYRAMVR